MLAGCARLSYIGTTLGESNRFLACRLRSILTFPSPPAQPCAACTFASGRIQLPCQGSTDCSRFGAGSRHTQNMVKSFGAVKEIRLPVMALPGRLHQPVQIVTGMSGLRRRPALSVMLGQQRLSHAGLQRVLLEAAKIENSLDTCKPIRQTPGAASLSTSHEDLLQLA